MKIKLDEGAIAPVRAHETDAGLDLISPVNSFVPAGGSSVIDTGVHVEIPEGHYGDIKTKSGLNIRHNIMTDGTIDEGYTGSIVVKLYNLGKTDYQVKRGDKIAQMVVTPVSYVDLEIVEEITGGSRGDSGFGSTGRSVLKEGE